MQSQHLLISSGAYLTPGVPQFLSKPSQLPASPPNLGACTTHHTLPFPGHTSRVYLYFLCPEQRVLEGTPATCSTVERLRREILHSSLLRFPQSSATYLEGLVVCAGCYTSEPAQSHPNKGSVSSGVSTPWQPWTLGGTEGGTLHWSLAAEALGATARTVDLTASTARQRAGRGRRRGGPV